MEEKSKKVSLPYKHTPLPSTLLPAESTEQAKSPFFIQHKKTLVVGLTSCILLTGLAYTLYRAIDNPQASTAGLAKTWNWMLANPILCLGFLSLTLATVAWQIHKKCKSELDFLEQGKPNKTSTIKKGSVLFGSLVAIYLGNLIYQHQDSPFLQAHWKPLAAVPSVLIGVCLVLLLINHFYKTDDEIPVDLMSPRNSNPGKLSPVSSSDDYAENDVETQTGDLP